MTAEPSPRPWRFVDPFDDGFPVVRDANERQVATLDGATPDLNEANAALIVDAVNFYDRTVDKQLVALLDERDRLRDIVRRLANNISRYHLVGERERALLREARAAIGKDASP